MLCRCKCVRDRPHRLPPCAFVSSWSLVFPSRRGAVVVRLPPLAEGRVLEVVILVSLFERESGISVSASTGIVANALACSP